MKAVVIIPTYNEAANLERMVEKLLSFGIDGLGILIIDDNSPDGTGVIADELAKRLPGVVNVLHRESKLGLGTAYIAGFKWALQHDIDLVCEMDADFSHPVDHIPRFLQEIEGYDVVVGSRYAPGGELDPSWGWSRKWISSIGNSYARLVTGLKVRDATGGFRCFRRQALEGLDLDRVRSSGFVFQVEMAYACQKKGYRVKELPIYFADRSQGKSKMSAKIIWEALWRVWQMKWRY